MSRTLFMLMAQYEGKVVLPLDVVCRDFFSHLSPQKLLRKIDAGEVNLPVMRMDRSQKCAKGVHLDDLAAYLDRVRAAAVKEAAALAS